MHSSILPSEQSHFNFKKQLGYFGFIPNQVLKETTCLQSLTYSIVQYLSVFRRPIEAVKIASYLHTTPATIRNTLYQLRKKGILAKNNKQYLFKCYVTHQLIEAKKLLDCHKGFSIPLVISAEPNLSNAQKLVFSILLSFIKKQNNYPLTTPFIANILNKSHDVISPILRQLHNGWYIHRKREGIKKPYRYTLGLIGSKLICKNHPVDNSDDSVDKSMKSVDNPVDYLKKYHQDACTKRHQDACHNNKKNNNIYTTKIEEDSNSAETSDSDAYNNNIFLLRKPKELFSLSQIRPIGVETALNRGIEVSGKLLL